MAEREILPPFAMQELTGWSLIQIAFWAGSTAFLDDAFGDICDAPVPARVGDVSGQEPVRIIRVAPDRVWIVDDASTLARPLAEALDPQSVSLTILTHGRRRLRLTGAHVTDVLAKGIPLDLDAGALSPGRFAQTALHRVPVSLHRLRTQMYDLYIPRSFAASIEEWLADAAADIAPVTATSLLGYAGRGAR